MEIDSNPRVSCVLVNWNGWQDTIECVNALKKCTYPNMNIVIVDNGSTNDSIAKIRLAHPDITLLESGKNLGYAGGNNIGIRYALAGDVDYIWMLNNDTKPAPNALSTLIAKASADSSLGAVASICYYADRPDTVQVWAGAHINLWIGYVRNSTMPHSDDWFHSLYGASLLIKRAAFVGVGLLDEGFFHYWEETEFCVRLRKRGWKLAAAPDSRVLHKVGASTGGYNVVLDRYFTTSGLRILRLHSSIPSLAMFLFLLARFVRRILRLQFGQCASVWRGIQDYRRSHPIVQKIS
jgi:GT2 family glycosyltransferase